MTSWLLAAIHLLALGIGLGAIWHRAWALRRASDRAMLQRAFKADALWGVAALVWLATGLARAFGGYDKGAEFYLASPMFHLKMALLALILVLELWPMVSLIRWRVHARQGKALRLSRAGLFARISEAQMLLLILMIFAATAMARGMGGVG